MDYPAALSICIDSGLRGKAWRHPNFEPKNHNLLTNCIVYYFPVWRMFFVDAAFDDEWVSIFSSIGIACVGVIALIFRAV